MVSSPAHEQILRDTARRAFPGHPATFTLSAGADLPPDWSLVTDHALRAVAKTYSATAEIYADSVFIRGLTADPPEWNQARTRLQMLLPADMSLRTSVATIALRDTLDGMCQRLFARAITERKVEFGRTSADLGGGAYALLDTLAELAMDCQEARITVIGNGDGGASSAQLGRERAGVVADYLKRQGVAADRLIVRGNAAPTNGRVGFKVDF
jgi:outer membrane protein OmpA-like peptidoglycan-associated protein